MQATFPFALVIYNYLQLMIMYGGDFTYEVGHAREQKKHKK